MAKPTAPEQTPEPERVEPHTITVGSGDSEQKVLVYVSPGKLTATPDVFMFLHGYDADYGARPLRRVLQRELADRLAVLLLDGTVHAGDTVQIGLLNDQLSFH